MDPRIRMTLRIIEEHGSSIPLSLTGTSRTLGLSETYMNRLFHREVGKTFRRHLLEVRMIRAANLVKQRAQPMKQIALEFGYSDLSNFYRDFRKIHGTTPRQLRNDHLLKQITESPGIQDVFHLSPAQSGPATLLSHTNSRRQPVSGHDQEQNSVASPIPVAARLDFHR